VTRLYIGTSGYSYAPWKGRFYPADIKPAQMLAYYSQHFQTVEINSSFYRMPTPAMLATWAAQVPDDFRFGFKAPRRITHDRRLAGAAEDTGYFLETTAGLGERRGPLLFQLPPSSKCDIPRLQNFLAGIVPGTPAAFEFRHASWNDAAVHQLLHEHGAAWCVAEMDEADGDGTPWVATADWGYLRLRRADYSDAELAEWLARIRAQSWREAYVYFKHEDEALGPAYAQRLRKLAAAAEMTPAVPA
jgi:uncharacterized protein YecE (DUF72 family)